MNNNKKVSKLSNQQEKLGVPLLVDPYQQEKKKRKSGFNQGDNEIEVDEESNFSDEMRTSRAGTMKGFFQGMVSKQSLANRIILPEEDQQGSCMGID